MKKGTLRGTMRSVVGSSKRTLFGTILIVAVLAGVITALTIQHSNAKSAVGDDNSSKTRSTNVTKQNRKNYVTTDANGNTIVLNRETGQSRPLTDDESRRLARGLKELINRSQKGLVQVERGDGSVSLDLQGRFQNVTVAKIEADGSVSESCVDNLESAAAFFEIDPKLVGLTNVSKAQPKTDELEDR